MARVLEGLAAGELRGRCATARGRVAGWRDEGRGGAGEGRPCPQADYTGDGAV